MYNQTSLKLSNQEGSTLIIVVLVLLVVTVLGVLSTRTALIEQQVATFDKVHKMTWHATDAVVSDLMPQLLEINIENRGWPPEYGDLPITLGNDFNVYTPEIYMNETCSIPSDANRDVSMSNMNQTDVNVTVFGNTDLLPGNSTLMVEGYHGRGKGMAGGGAAITYTIFGVGRGVVNSEARVAAGYRHVI
ncbi:MAG: hypothetical protein HKP58_19080 [Desulfatitalea sp.]|nr:hypothetical protein [Desulfatitalea sp.]NNK02520.1 hypothetical protein [Desulfatitalea sp.]